MDMGNGESRKSHGKIVSISNNFEQSLNGVIYKINYNKI